MSIQVAIVEDDATIRSGLKMIINATVGFNCVSDYGSAEAALETILDKQPDVILMDIDLPGMSGIELIKQLKEKTSAIQIIMLTIFENNEEIFKSLSAGANGYLLKKTPPVKLLEAITDVYNGGSPMSSEIARKVVTSFQQHEEKLQEKTAQLSVREQEILALLAKGFRYKEIADQLFISLDTVRTHIRNIYEKLQVNSRTEAVLKYLGK